MLDESGWLPRKIELPIDLPIINGNSLHNKAYRGGLSTEDIQKYKKEVRFLIFEPLELLDC